jgi:hypothetical protein
MSDIKTAGLSPRHSSSQKWVDLVGSATRGEAILIGRLAVPIDVAVATGAITATRGNSTGHDVIGCTERSGSM